MAAIAARCQTKHHPLKWHTACTLWGNANTFWRLNDAAMIYKKNEMCLMCSLGFGDTFDFRRSPKKTKTARLQLNRWNSRFIGCEKNNFQLIKRDFDKKCHIIHRHFVTFVRIFAIKINSIPNIRWFHLERINSESHFQSNDSNKLKFFFQMHNDTNDSTSTILFLSTGLLPFMPIFALLHWSYAPRFSSQVALVLQTNTQNLAAQFYGTVWGQKPFLEINH